MQKKRILLPLMLLVLSALSFISTVGAADPVETAGGLYWECATATGLGAGTRYYPSRAGLSIGGYKNLSVYYSHSGAASATFEASYALSATVRKDASAGDDKIYLYDVSGFSVGQVVLIDSSMRRVISSVNTKSKLIELSAPISADVSTGAGVLSSDDWFDITQSGYDVVNHAYNNAGYGADSTGAVDYDGIYAMRFRIKNVVGAETDKVQYKVRLK